MREGRQNTEKTLILIRHAATSGNQNGCYIGKRTDESLSESGRNQAADMRDRFKTLAEGAIWFSGPMKRCVETAKVFAPEETPVVIDAFREIDFGDFEGKTYKELSGDHAYQAWIDSGGNLPFPGGEKREDYVNLQLQGFRSLLNRLGDRSKAAVICHGGTIMAIMSDLTGGAYFDFRVSHLDGYIIRFNGDNERISDLSYDRLVDWVSG
ncbi:MAG: histidine phosphatase family protein [Lachnospiraceae bacterium]|nr:histidine phosphatase family protein [Lachnospiraceae bacterium]